MRERWVANFSKPERSCFDIKPEISRNAKLENGSLFLGLKKSGLMTWLETANRVYVDQVIEARFRLDGLGGYCAAGIMFRIMEKGTYYLALVSNKGYFRFDAVNDKVPKTLIGWTEVADVDADGNDADLERMDLGIVARGGHFIFTLNGKWIAEVNDDSIPGGHLGFSLVSYGSGSAGDARDTGEPGGQAWLDYLSVDSRPKAVEQEYMRWDDGAEISAESRLCLAETFAALKDFDAAYSQIQKAWKQRENAVRSITATYTDLRNGKELLFAARMAALLGRYKKAEEHVNACLSAETSSGADKTEALAEKAKILSALGKSAPDKFRELVAFLPDYVRGLETGAESPAVPQMYALLGHAWWNLKDYGSAAAAWSRAFELNGDNGLYAENAAEAYAALGRKEEALGYFIAGGSRYLRQANFEKLGAMVPGLLAVGRNKREAHMLVWEWAKGIGDFGRAEAEFALAERACLPEEPASEGEPGKVGLPMVEVVEENTAKGAGTETEIRKKPAGKTKAKLANVTETSEKAAPEKTGVEARKKPVGIARGKAAKVAEAPKKATSKKAGTETKTGEKPVRKAKTTKVAKTPEKTAPRKAETITEKKPVRKAKATVASEKAAPKTKAPKVSPAKEPAKPRAKATSPKPATKTKAKQDSPGKKPVAKPKDKPAPKGRPATKPGTEKTSG